MTRTLTIRKATLEILERAEPYALPERQLLVELNTALRPPAAQAEFDDALIFLNIRNHIAIVPDNLDETFVKWVITETGKAVIRQ